MRFDELLKEKRKETGLSIIEAASAVGVSTSTYHAWEKFFSVPSKRNAEKIKNILGVDITESADKERNLRKQKGMTVSKTNPIAQAIAKERKRRGWSFERVCKMYGVTISVWKRWEQSNVVNYSDREIEIISEFTGKSKMELWRMQNTRRWNNHPQKWWEMLEALDNKDYGRAAEIGRKYF